MDYATSGTCGVTQIALCSFLYNNVYVYSTSGRNIIIE